MFGIASLEIGGVAGVIIAITAEQYIDPEYLAQFIFP
jgi:hypothetical protein